MEQSDPRAFRAKSESLTRDEITKGALSRGEVYGYSLMVIYQRRLDLPGERIRTWRHPTLKAEIPVSIPACPLSPLHVLLAPPEDSACIGAFGITWVTVYERSPRPPKFHLLKRRAEGK